MCGRCSGRQHTEKNEKCLKDPLCRSCDSLNLNAKHTNYDKECPIWKREKEIVLIKEIQKVPYPVARGIYEKQGCAGLTTEKRQYSEVVDKPQESNKTWEDKLESVKNSFSIEIQNITAQFEEKLSQLAAHMSNTIQKEMAAIRQLLENQVLPQQLAVWPVNKYVSERPNTNRAPKSSQKEKVDATISVSKKQRTEEEKPPD